MIQNICCVSGSSVCAPDRKKEHVSLHCQVLNCCMHICWKNTLDLSVYTSVCQCTHIQLYHGDLSVCVCMSKSVQWGKSAADAGQTQSKSVYDLFLHLHFVCGFLHTRP